MHHRSRRLLFFISTLFFFTPAFLLFAAGKVKALHSDGTLELAEGQKISLAGLEIPLESHKMITTLVSGKEIDYEPEPDLPAADAGVWPAYVYVFTDQVNFPFDPAAKPEVQKVMLNELLLQTGAAKLKGSQEFRFRKRFAELQEQARAAGQGVWSYESFGKSKKQQRKAEAEQAALEKIRRKGEGGL